MKQADDHDLNEVFAKLKAEDARRVPRFTVPFQQRPIPAAWRPGTLPMVAGFAAAAVICLVLVFQPDPTPADDPHASPIAFEDLSDVIAREVFVASVSEWESPTQFLLNPEFPSNNH